MSGLDKLAIRGVRSFDNSQMQVLEFSVPVTVIVGSNGTGKTTIIECLKYATTGILPPNTKTTGAFIHDPKLAGENEVKAQVKLRFKNASRERMIVTRNVSVTVKKTGLSMKTLEGILSKDEANEGNTKRNTISTKCSEIDSEVPRLLGVSQAILDNVIFCHQEESNWPLATPADLKKKFDEIFEATKFTDALDSIKKMRKDRAADLKVEKEKLSHLQHERTRANNITVKVQQLTQRIERQEAIAADVGARAQELAEINLNFREKAGEFTEVFARQESLKHEISVWEEQIASYEDSITLLKESDQDLQIKALSFNEEMDTKKKRKTEFQNCKSDQEDELRKLDRELSTIVQQKGVIVGQKATHEDAIRQREAAAKQICNQYDFRGYDCLPLEKEKIDEIIDKLHSHLKRQEVTVRQMKDESRRKEQEFQENITRLSNDKASETGNRDSLRRQMNEIETSIRADTRESQDHSVDVIEAELAMVEADIAKENKNLEDTEKAVAEANYEERKKTLRGDIASREAERESLNAEFATLNQQSEARATLNVKKDALTRKLSYLEIHLEKTKEPHRTLIGKDPAPETIESDVAQAIIVKEGEITAAERKRTLADRALAAVETTLTLDKQRLSDKQAELKDLDARVTEICEDADESSSFEVALATARECIERAKGDIEFFTQVPKLVSRCVDSAKSTKKVCVGCDRKVKYEEIPALERYLAKLQSTADSQNGQSLREAQSDLVGWEELLTRLLRIQPEVEKMPDLRVRVIPTLSSKLSATEVELKKAKTTAKTAASAVETLKQELKDLLNLRTVAASITKAFIEKCDLSSEVMTLQQNFASTGSVRMARDVEKELSKLAGEIKSFSQDLMKLGLEQDKYAKEAQSSRNTIHQKEMQKSRYHSDFQKFKAIELRLDESRTSLEALKLQLRDSDAKIVKADEPIRKLQDELAQYRRQASQDLFVEEAGLQSHAESVGELDRANRAVEKWTEENGPSRLRRIEDALLKKEAEAQEVREAIAQSDAVIKEIETQIYQSDKNRKNLEDNIRHRSFKERVAKAKIQMAGLGVEEAARARDQYNSKYGKSKQKETDLNSQYATLMGEISQLKAQLLEQKEVLAVEYKTIDADYMSKLIEVQTSGMATEDLQKYGAALDSAIMRYHSVKMKEINENLKYLWNKTYQGTDIDNILIRSDADSTKVSATKTNYNYRVVMVKDQVEMDMRGRCSAGQKVLASIIIRLALSDSFGHNCGIIALDEPTTNLDAENIKSLAVALAAIIEERKKNGRFQLVVITHDESFLREISMNSDIDYYIKLTRDQHQKSVITKHKLRG